MDSLGVLKGRDSLVILEYPIGGGSGPLYISEAYSRFSSFYGQTGIPHTVFDGYLAMHGTTGSVAGDLGAFNIRYGMRHQSPSPVRMSMEGGIAGRAGYVRTRIEAVDDVSMYADLRFMFVVYENNITYSWPNGMTHHMFIARDMIPDPNGESIALDQGDTLTMITEFTLDPSWNVDEVSAAAFVQDFNSMFVIQAVDFATAQAIEEFPAGLEPELMTTLKAEPNPARDRVRFLYELPEASQASLRVFDPSGRLVRSFELGVQSEGSHVLTWTLGDAEPGVYFCELRAGSERLTEKIIVSR